MIDSKKGSKLYVKSTVEKLKKDLMEDKRGNVIDIKKVLAEKTRVEYDYRIIPDVCNPAHKLNEPAVEGSLKKIVNTERVEQCRH